MGNLPNVNITLGNGKLGRSQATSDGVAGMVLTGAAVAEKLVLGKHYVLSSTRDLDTLGITPENNPLANKDIRAFYAQAGDGAELHILIVSPATTLTQICDPGVTSPLSKLLDGSGGRVRISGANKIPAAGYTPDLTQGIDLDAITAGTAAQQCLTSFDGKIQPARMFLPAAGWTGGTEELYKPRASSTNRVGYVIASDDPVNNTASIGEILGRAAAIEVHRSVARVKDGAVRAEGWYTDGSTFLEKAGLAELLNDAGYIFYRKYPTKNGCYFNDDHMAAPMTDDYSNLNLGRVIDKAKIITYDTYISEIMDNIEVDADGRIPTGACKNFEGMLNNAINNQMGSQISSFRAYVDPDQNVLSTSRIKIAARVVPQGTLRAIDVDLSFDNPFLAND